MYNAETFRTALLDSQKQGFAFSQRMLDWQLSQMKVAETQVKSQIEASRQLVESGVELAKANQKAWLDSFATAKA